MIRNAKAVDREAADRDFAHRDGRLTAPALGLVDRSSATILPTVSRFSVPTVSLLISARTRVEVTSVSSLTRPCVSSMAWSRSSNLPSANVEADSKLR